MIVASIFAKDENDRVMMVQHASYGDVIALWAGCVIDRCRLYEASFLVSTVAGVQLTHSRRFDHRVIQHVHDLVAAAFRFRFAATTPLFDQWDDDAYWDLKWREWAESEWETLLNRPEFFQHMATSLGLSNTKSGFRAEREAAEYIQYWYHDVPWCNRHADD